MEWVKHIQVIWQTTAASVAPRLVVVPNGVDGGPLPTVLSLAVRPAPIVFHASTNLAGDHWRRKGHPDLSTLDKASTRRRSGEAGS